MPRRKPVNPEEAARDTIAREIPMMVDAIAVKQGPAADATAVSDAKVLRQWGQRDPKILDPDGMRRQMIETGLPMEMLDPQSPTALAFIKANQDIAGEWAEILASPLDERMADLAAPLIEHPMRLGILRPYEDDPEEATRVSDRLDAQLQREMERALQAPSAPAMVGG